MRQVAAKRQRHHRVVVVDRGVAVAHRLESGFREVRLDLLTSFEPPATNVIGEEERIVREELGHAIDIRLLSALEPFLD